MRRKRAAVRRVAVGGAGVALALVAWLALPRLGARLSLFRLRRIELVGVHHLAPEAVIGALRLPADANVFADPHLLADRVRSLSGVADARVRRRLPGTLEVRVREVEPVAFVSAGGDGRLVPVDGRGHLLPFDPAQAGLDLPIAATEDSGVAGVLALVQSVDPSLFAQITGARVLGEKDVALELGDADVLFGRDARAAEVRAVELVTEDLAARGRAHAELDARFAGQVVVRARPALARRARRGRAGSRT